MGSGTDSVPGIIPVVSRFRMTKKIQKNSYFGSRLHDRSGIHDDDAELMCDTQENWESLARDVMEDAPRSQRG